MRHSLEDCVQLPVGSISTLWILHLQVGWRYPRVFQTMNEWANKELSMPQADLGQTADLTAGSHQ